MNQLRRIVFCLVVILMFSYKFIDNSITNRSHSLHKWYRKEQRSKRPMHINQDHGYCGPCPQDKLVSDAWTLIDLVNLISVNRLFLLNIGAASANGGQYDPTYPLLNSSRMSFSAILVDPNTDRTLFDAYYALGRDIKIIHDFVWSETVIENIFHKYHIPQDLTVLKIDVDSYECSLIETILHANYRPQLIHIEFNPIFRPPTIFMPIYNSTTKNDWKPPLWLKSDPFYGCSLSALSTIVLTYDYVLVEVDFWDAIYIQRHLAAFHRIQIPANDLIAYEYGFLKHPCLSYCQQNTKLYNKKLDNIVVQHVNSSTFVKRMRNVLNQYAPRSFKTNMRHSYIINRTILDFEL